MSGWMVLALLVAFTSVLGLIECFWEWRQKRKGRR